LPLFMIGVCPFREFMAGIDGMLLLGVVGMMFLVRRPAGNGVAEDIDGEFGDRCALISHCRQRSEATVSEIDNALRLTLLTPPRPHAITVNKS